MGIKKWQEDIAIQTYYAFNYAATLAHSRRREPQLQLERGHEKGSGFQIKQAGPETWGSAPTLEILQVANVPGIKAVEIL